MQSKNNFLLKQSLVFFYSYLGLVGGLKIQKLRKRSINNHNIFKKEKKIIRNSDILKMNSKNLENFQQQHLNRSIKDIYLYHEGEPSFKTCSKSH